MVGITRGNQQRNRNRAKSAYSMTDLKVSDSELLLLEELLKEEMYDKSEKSLYQFLINFWSTFSPEPLVNNWHLECMGEHIQAALNRDIRRLILNVPPRSSKSILGSICAPIFHHINHPEEKFWLLSHSMRLYMQNIVYARRILEHPLYKERWCNVDSEHYRYSISKDVNTKSRIDNNKGGYLMGGSPTSTALGMGYTVAILDDILDSQEANSRVAIENVNNWYTQTFMNRSNNPNNDVVIIVMQRLSQFDICAYVQKTYAEQDWFVLNLPARYDSKRTFISPIGYNDKRRIENEVLDPIRLSDEFLIAQEKDPIIYNTRYLQNPEASVGTNTYSKDWLKYTTEKPLVYDQLITVWDLSFTDNPTSTHTVGLVVGLVDSKYYVIDMFRQQVDIPSQLEAILTMKNKYPDSIVGIEAKANGHAAMALLKSKIADIYPFNPTMFGGSKEQRLGVVTIYGKNGEIFLYDPPARDDMYFRLYPSRLPHPDYDVEVIKKELFGFPLAETDDIVDCFAYAIQYLSMLNVDNQTLITKGKKILYEDVSDTYIVEKRDSMDSILVFSDDNYSWQDILDLGF